jgi:hypothetical protein
MRVSLKPHPDHPGRALSGLEVELTRLGARRFRLLFAAHGDPRHIAMPRQALGGKRTDGLWQHSCFEAFFRGAGDEAYYEFNLAPSGDWAAYRLSSYRAGMKPAHNVGEPRIGTIGRRRAPTDEERALLELTDQDPLDRFPKPCFGITAILDLKQAADLPGDRPWRIGLSAVIEERNGAKSFWALAHPPGDPDFHHDDCFALELAPPA